MKSACRFAVATFATTLPVLATAAPPRARPHAPPVAAVRPLPMLPSVPRVRLEVLEKTVVVVQEVNLPRGEWKSEALDFYVAFGAPGPPRAIDAQLVAVGDGALEPDDADPGEALLLDRAPQRPPNAHPLLGRDTMAGVIVHVKRESFARALVPSGMAALRIRTALDLPDEDAAGAHGIVVRLGASRGTPLTLGRVSVVTKPGGAAVLRADARLCGADAATTPLAIAIEPRPVVTPPVVTPPIAPVLAVRHATDDLCLRYWTS